MAKGTDPFSEGTVPFLAQFYSTQPSRALLTVVTTSSIVTEPSAFASPVQVPSTTR